MAEPAARRKKRHAAAPARILTAGLSSAAALGMVAGMAATRTDPEAAMAEPAAATPGQVAAPPPEQMVLVIRRHWLTAPSAALPVTGVAVPLRATGGTAAAAATPARPRPSVLPSPRPAPRPVTRTRGS